MTPPDRPYRAIPVRLHRRSLLKASAAFSVLGFAIRPFKLLAQDTNSFGAPLDAAGAADRVVTRIAFGSCADQTKPQPIWDTIVGDQPDLFVFLGDNVYADTTDMSEMQRAYDQLGAKPGYRDLRRRGTVIATWDDHDYGLNDAGRTYPRKEDARRIFLNFFDEPENSPRRTRPDGIYTSYAFGPEGRRVQVILLDVRWNRSPQTRVSDSVYAEERKPNNQGPYVPSDDPDATMLGVAQWAWLEARLREPADLRVVCSSLPVLPEFSGWETWANFPHERQRLFDLVSTTKAHGVLLLSGDTHYADVSRVAANVPYPLWEITSSSLTHTWGGRAPNRHRQGSTINVNNYGVLRIDWTAPNPTVTVEIRDVDGALHRNMPISLSSLQA